MKVRVNQPFWMKWEQGKCIVNTSFVDFLGKGTDEFIRIGELRNAWCINRVRPGTYRVNENEDVGVINTCEFDLPKEIFASLNSEGFIEWVDD